MGALESLTATPFKAPSPVPTSLSSLTSKPYTPPTQATPATAKPSALTTLTSTPYTATPAAKPEQPAVTSTIPPKLGGGAYNRVPGNNEKVVNTGHTSYAGMPAKPGYQRNDIVPVSLGGENSNAKNMEYEPQNEADYRDGVEKYYAAQVKSGKIPLNAARTAVLNWKDTDIPGQAAYNKKFGGPENLASNTIKSIPEGVKATAGAVKEVADEAVSGAKEGWEQSQKQNQPKSFGNLGEKSLDAGWKNLSDTLQDSYHRITNVVDAAKDEHTTKLQMGASEEEAAMGVANVLFSTVTTPLAALEGVPGIGTLVDKVNGLFAAIGGGASKVASGAVDDMPISDEAKETIRQPVEEVSALLGQLIAGDAGSEVIPKIADKSKAIVSAIKDHVDTIPSKQGGFVKNPFATGDVTKDAQDLHEAAKAHDADFKKKVEQVARDANAKVKHGPVKKPERIIEKAQNENKGDVSKTHDTNRSTILVDHPNDIHDVVQSVKKTFGEATRIKSSDSEKPGYKSTIINVATPHGTNAEIQVTTPEMLHAKDELGGHDMYRQLRNQEKPDTVLMAKMNKLYDDAHARAAARLRASASEIGWPSERALSGEYPAPDEKSGRTTSPQTSLPSESTRTIASDSISKNRGYLGLDDRDIQLSIADKDNKVKQPTRPGGRKIATSLPPELESEIGSQTQAARTESTPRRTSEEFEPTEKMQVRHTVPLSDGTQQRPYNRSAYAEHGNEEVTSSYTPIITENNGGVIPPVNKGGLVAPEIDFTKANDKAAIRLSTDTMERNVEKVFGDQADKVNDFLVKQVRKNETDRADFVDHLYKEVKDTIVNKLGIRARSLESTLVQKLGEGLISIDDVRSQAPDKAANIEAAVKYFRQKYDTLWNMWNDARTAHGLKSIGRIDNYFRHFTEFGSFMENFLPTNSTGKLPTAIAGITDYFKSRTPWSSAAMRRTGKDTAFDAVSGMQNYIEVASRAIFHTDSVQRGRLLEKYIRDAADANNNDPAITKKINLGNFVSNLNDWTNLVSGKQARLDRAIESVVGRPTLAFMRKVIRQFGLNVIGGNISAATTHSIPLVYTLATVDTASAFRGLMTTLPKPFLQDFSTIGGEKSAFLTRRFMSKTIDPTVGEKVGTAISKPFQWVDEFISHFAVASKFDEGITQGLSSKEAMAAADNYAGRVIGDRSTGNLPNLMNTKTLGLITQFQIEVNDNLRVLMHDVPRWEKGNAPKIALTLAKFAVYSYMFNQVMKMIKGTGKGLDPIDMGMTLAGLNEEGRGKTTMERLQQTGTDLAGELPFASVLTQGQYPALQGLPISDVTSGNYGVAAQKFASSYLSPVGGGVQALKTYKGIAAWKAGVVLDASGKTITPVPQTPLTLFQGAAFGPNAFSGVQKSHTELGNLAQLIKTQQATSKAKNQQAAAIWSDLKDIRDTQGGAAAEAQLTSIATQDPDMAKRVLNAMDNDEAGITKSDLMIKNLGIANGSRAAYIKQQLDGMNSNDEKQQYLLDLAEKKILTDEVLNQVLSQ